MKTLDIDPELALGTDRDVIMNELFHLEELNAEITAGYVRVSHHDSLPLTIYTYSRACQYEQRWNRVTTRCRGLVVEQPSGRIVGWCMPKFFNHDQHGQGHPFAPPLPNETPHRVYDKADGSLGTVFWYEGKWRVATKGSFYSDQATWAQQWLDDTEPSGLLIPGHTYVTEIVYPENRIVVDYRGERTLVLLAVYAPDGTEQRLEDYAEMWQALGGRVIRSWPPAMLPELVRAAQEDRLLDGSTATGTNAEGWVIRYVGGLRVKVKVGEYVRLHKRLTGTNAVDVWRAYGAQLFAELDAVRLAQTIGVSKAEAARLATVDAGALAALLVDVPDEFDQWVRSVVDELDDQYWRMSATISNTLVAVMSAAKPKDPTPKGRRAAFAVAAQQLVADPVIRSGLFLRYDDRDTGPHVWRAVRPSATNPFRDDQDR